MHRPAPPGSPANDDVSSDEEDEMPPPEAAEAEDQGLDDLHPGRPIEPAALQVGAQDQDGPHLDRPTETEPRLPHTEAQDQDGLHPGRLIKPASQPGRQPTDHGRVQRLDDDRPPCPLIAYPEATPGPSHARPHANPRASHHPLIIPTSQPGRQPTDHGRVQRLNDDRPPCPLIAYSEATPGPSHARPHAETKPPARGLFERQATAHSTSSPQSDRYSLNNRRCDVTATLRRSWGPSKTIPIAVSFALLAPRTTLSQASW
ncbi:basic salivary proline-rich protein 4-like [Anoplophora glabripennis]|uniref:basic salivary proline-rich protein 4-like n=1 Tax=Anoplophora glabripennis TaxID=217634 RepID=UPI000C763634|nr:basic salivary proline-rich protein 4-like [Anoplophora glabripennis]